MQLFELVRPGGRRIDRTRRCCKPIRSGLTLIFFFNVVSWFRLFLLNRTELAGVERRRIYDIVNILESVGVRVLFVFLVGFCLDCCTVYFNCVFILSDFSEESQESVFVEGFWGNS